MTFVKVATLCAAALLAAGCGGIDAAKLAPELPPILSGEETNTHKLPADGIHVLNKEELALDCKKLAGRIQVRILQMRADKTGTKSSGVARSIQSAAVPVMGGTSHGADPAGLARFDRAVLEAYNKQLTAKNCAAFDLEADMKDGATEMPRPVKPSKKS